MFVLTNNSVVDRAIAALVATSLVLWGVGVQQQAQAATLLNISDLLSDSAPSVVSNHTLSFEVPGSSDGVDENGDTIEYTFPAGFDMTGLVSGDIAIDINGAPEVIGAGDWLFSTSSQQIILTSDGASLQAADVFTMTVTGAITNQAAVGSYEIDVEILDDGTTPQDSGTTEIAIIDTVLVTADVDTIFEFYLNGLPSGYGVNGDTTTQSGTTTTVPFGTLDSGVPSVVGQQLRVITNSNYGFSVTVETDQQLTASNLADIDSFSDATGLDSDNAAAWTSPSGDIGDENTWGHWGMTTDDESLADGDLYGATLYSAVLSTPQEVMYHDDVTDGIVANEGSTTVAYKAEIMSFQEAADDYTATLTYIATPTF